MPTFKLSFRLALATYVWTCVWNFSPAATKTEDFDANPGWTVVGSGANGNAFGYQSASSNAGGATGEGGGRFTRDLTGRLYADTNLGGVLTLDNSISASGKFDYTNAQTPDFGQPLMVGHFNSDNPGSAEDFNSNKVGLWFNGQSPSNLLQWGIWIRFSDGSKHQLGFGDIDPNIDRTWDYAWNPSGGVFGEGQLTATLSGSGGGVISFDLTSAERARGMSVKAFGLSVSFPQPPDPTSSAFAEVFIDDVIYSVPEPSAGVLVLIGLALIAIAHLNRVLFFGVVLQSRSRWVVCVLTLVSLFSATGAWAAVETFDSASSAAANGWIGFQNTIQGNSFGFSNTNAAGGAAGEAGGILSRNIAANKGYYADTTQGGTLNLDSAISGSGLIRFVDTANADNSLTLGHFTVAGYTGGNQNVIGIDFSEVPPPNRSVNVRVNARLILSDGTTLNSDDDAEIAWVNIAKFDYAYDPLANSGLGQLVAHARDSLDNILATRMVNLTAGDRSTGASFDAFGLSQFGMSSETSNSMTVFVDNLQYSAIPEPSTLALGAIGAALAIVFGRGAGALVIRRARGI